MPLNAFHQQAADWMSTCCFGVINIQQQQLTTMTTTSLLKATPAALLSESRLPAARWAPARVSQVAADYDNRKGRRAERVKLPERRRLWRKMDGQLSLRRLSLMARINILIDYCSAGGLRPDRQLLINSDSGWIQIRLSSGGAGTHKAPGMARPLCRLPLAIMLMD